MWCQDINVVANMYLMVQIEYNFSYDYKATVKSVNVWNLSGFT